MKRKAKKGTLLMVAGLLLIAAALAVLLYNVWDGRRAGAESENVAQVLEQVIAEHRNHSPEMPPVPDEEASPEPEYELVEIDGNLYAGVLEIPVLGLKLPVMESWSMPKLRLAPCVYSGWYTSDDFVIAAHNYLSHFGSLHRLRPNDEVYFTAVDGTVFHYVVDYFETLDGSEIDRMRDKTIWDMTLFTCTTSGRSRYAVRCVRLP